MCFGQATAEATQLCYALLCLVLYFLGYKKSKPYLVEQRYATKIEYTLAYLSKRAQDEGLDS